MNLKTDIIDSNATYSYFLSLTEESYKIHRNKLINSHIYILIYKQEYYEYNLLRKILVFI